MDINTLIDIVENRGNAMLEFRTEIVEELKKVAMYEEMFNVKINK